jgi:hypothetical protein
VALPVLIRQAMLMRECAGIAPHSASGTVTGREDFWYERALRIPYNDYPYYGDYEGGCYLVDRVLTRHGWHSHRVAVCDLL